MSSNILLDYKCSLIQKMFEYGSWNNLYSMKSVRDFKLIAFCALRFVDFFVVESSWFSSPLSTICGPFDHSLTYCLNCPLLPLPCDYMFVLPLAWFLLSFLVYPPIPRPHSGLHSLPYSLCHLLSYFCLSYFLRISHCDSPIQPSKFFPRFIFTHGCFFFLSFFSSYFRLFICLVPFLPPPPPPLPPFTHPPSLAVSFLRLGVPFP